MKALLLVMILTFASFEHIAQTQPEIVSQLPLQTGPVSVRDFTLSPDGNEAYFTLLSPLEDASAIVRITKSGNSWSAPALASFSKEHRNLEPYLSPDGLRLYFASNRPTSAEDTVQDFDLWYVERKHMGVQWSAPLNLGAPVNTVHNEFYPAVARSGNLYFTSDAPGHHGKDDILISRWQDRQYTEPVALDTTINSSGYEFNAYIAPDESFLIFSGYARHDGLGSGDLYISFLNNGQWTQAKNLGPDINSKYMDYCPYLDLQSGTLYFTSKRSEITSGSHPNLEDFLKEINRYANGTSRLYKVAFSVSD